MATINDSDGMGEQPIELAHRFEFFISDSDHLHVGICLKADEGRWVAAICDAEELRRFAALATGYADRLEALGEAFAIEETE